MEEEKQIGLKIDDETYVAVPSWFLLASGEYLMANQLVIVDPVKRATDAITGSTEKILFPLIANRGGTIVHGPEEEDEEEDGDSGMFVRAGGGYSPETTGDEWKNPDLHMKLQSIRESGVLNYVAEWLPYQHHGQCVSLPKGIVMTKGFLNPVGSHIYTSAAFYYMHTARLNAEAIKEQTDEIKLFSVEDAPVQSTSEPETPPSPPKRKTNYQVPDIKTRMNVDGSRKPEFPDVGENKDDLFIGGGDIPPFDPSNN